MIINESKTNEMLVCFTRDPELGDSIPNIVINGGDIERVEHAKVFGVTISAYLSWNVYIYI